LFQTTEEGVDVLFVGRRQQKPIIYDLAAVQARFGVRPERLPAWMALVGDTSDNLIGVPGVGPGTAKKLLAKYHDIADLLQHLDEITPESLRTAIREARERIEQNERLARLDAAVPLPPGARVALPSAAAIERVRELFVELEFKSLLGRLPSAT